MRVICLVPSVTETLIDCGVNVVGRTRFCIHPQEEVASIPIVGGTKGVDWQKIRELKADIVIFDREENLKTMAEECPLPWHATHIRSIQTIADEFSALALKVASSRLSSFADKWRSVDAKPGLSDVDFDNVPGHLMPIANTEQNYKKIEYIIWRDPWMAVGRHTFISSMLNKLGFSAYLNNHVDAYPVLSADQMLDQDTFYLFSSEPYPFQRHQEYLKQLGINGAIVDGEVYSWFGSRSYRALASYLD